VWSDTIAASAQAWATHLTTSDTFGHSPREQRNGNGENIAFVPHGSEDPVRRAVMLWVSEKQNWHGGVMSQDNFLNTGHYTQMVWSSTTQIGCGIATEITNYPYQGSTWDYLVCQYAPPGNYMGQAPY
jgi:pathogenesis-related protein 1